MLGDEKEPAGPATQHDQIGLREEVPVVSVDGGHLYLVVPGLKEGAHIPGQGPGGPRVAVVNDADFHSGICLKRRTQRMRSGRST